MQEIYQILNSNIIEIQNRELENLINHSKENAQAFLQLYSKVKKQISDDSQKLTLHYLKALALKKINRREEAIKESMKVLTEAAAKNNYLILSKGNQLLSVLYKESNERYKQKPSLEIALEMAKKANDDNNLVECLLLLGAYYDDLNQLDKAWEYYTKAEKISEITQEPILLIKTKLGMGTISHRYQQYDKAIMYLSDALKYSKQYGDIKHQIIILNDLAIIYMQLENKQAVLDLINTGLDLAQKNNLNYQMLQLKFNLGSFFMKQSQYSEALNEFIDCQKLSQDIHLSNSKFFSELCSNIAGCYCYLQDYNLALQYIEKAEESIKNRNNTLELKELLTNKALILHRLKKTNIAINILNSVSKYFHQHKLYEQLINAQLNLSNCYSDLKNWDKALLIMNNVCNYYREYINYIIQEKTKDYHKTIKEILTKEEIKEELNNTEQHQSVLNLKWNLSNDIHIPNFIGQSSIHKKVLEAALIASQNPNANVLITGESGTGKDVIANIIHYNSIRRDYPFIAVNVAAISPGLLSGEFFGYKKGSFTSAISNHDGFFYQAHRGTLFLDEIGDMAPDLQAMILRALESKTIVQIGGTKEIPFDCRIISSTNQHIQSLIKNNQFRLDLYHRLNTIEIYIPPLRERKEDIELIFYYYLDYYTKDAKRQKITVTPDFMNTLIKLPFHGNVRELKNLVERLVIFTSKNVLDVDDLIAHTTERKVQPINSIRSIKPTVIEEKQLIINALNEVNGLQKDAALLLKISESTLSRKIKKYNLDIYTKKFK